MAETKRYDLHQYEGDWATMEEGADGDYVLYEDHVEAVVKLNVELVGMFEEKEYWRTLAMQAAQRGR